MVDKRIMQALIAFFMLSACADFDKNRFERLMTSDRFMDTFPYDPDFIRYAIARYDFSDYQDQQLPKFDRINALYDVATAKDETILSVEVMKKPPGNDLFAHYLITRLNWAEIMNTGNKGNPINPYTVVNKEITNLPTESEMLVAYYTTIFVWIRSLDQYIDLSAINIDATELNLNDTELAILFLTAMYQVGGKLATYSNQTDGCDKAQSLAKKIPLFNNQNFMEFNLPDIQDFQIKMLPTKPKESFLERHLPSFEKAVGSYKLCLEQ